MTNRDPKRGFAARPRDPDAWVCAPDVSATSAKVDVFTARLTVNITPELRGRIKVTAFRRGLTVADMLRALLDGEYPADTNPGTGAGS